MRALETFRPYSAAVLKRIRQLALPALDLVSRSTFVTGVEERPRRLSWARSSSRVAASLAPDPSAEESAQRTRSLSETSGTSILVESAPMPATLDTVLLTLSKKHMPQVRSVAPPSRLTQHARPDVNVSELGKIGSGFCLLSPSTLSNATGLFRLTTSPLEAWTLLCLLEAQPNACEILSLSQVIRILHLRRHHQQSDRKHKTNPCDADQLIEWLTQSSLEGCSMIEQRLGRGGLSAEGLLPDTNRYEDYISKGEHIHRLLCLRFGQMGAEKHCTPPEISADASGYNQESLWASALFRLWGDLIISTICK